MTNWTSGTNAVITDHCQKLGDVTVKLAVTEDLVTYEDGGFSLQLNCYPSPGVTSIGLPLNWIQFTLYVSNTYGSNEAAFQWQAWSLGATAFPPGYTVPPGTTNPNQPVPPFPQRDAKITTVPSNRLPKGSSLTIALTTDPLSRGVTAATFSVQLTGASAQSATLHFPADNPDAQFPIAGFQVDLVGPGNLSKATFVSAAGELTYSVPSGSSLSVQNGGVGTACGQYSGALTGESSNIVYGEVTPSSGSDLTQPFGFIWQGTPAAHGSALDGYWGSDDSQHVNFIGTDGHVHELYIHPGAGWVDNDLNQFAGGVLPAPGTVLDGYWGSDNSQHVNFIGTDGHVHELYIHPGAGWLNNDLSQMAGGVLPAPGTALDGYWGSDNSQHVNFIGTDGHVHELYIHPGAGWVDNDLNQFAGGVLPAPGTALDGYWGSDNSQHVNFIGTDGHVHELYIHPGAGWVDNDLNQFAGGVLPAPGTALDGYWGSDNSQHVNFIGTDGHVHELYIHPGAGWLNNDLSQMAGGVLPAPGTALDGYWGSDNSQHVNFIGTDGHVHELYIHPGAGWLNNDLSQMAGGVLPAPGTALDGYWGSDNSQHVNFIDLAGHVHELYIHPDAAWTNNDLSGSTQ